MKNALPDASAMNEVVERLTGRAPRSHETEEFAQKLSSHDLTDPLLMTTFNVNGREYRAKGNRITSCVGLKEDRLAYIDSNGHIHDQTAHSFEKWMHAFNEIGWMAQEGVSGMSDTRHPEQRHVLMRELTSFDRTDLPQPILMAFPCITPDGRPGTLSLRTFSLCDETYGAQRIIEAVEHARKIMPGGPEKARQATVQCVERLVAQIQVGLKHEISCKVTASDWRTAIVAITGLDNLLEPQEENVLLNMEQCRETGVRPENIDNEKLKAALKQQNTRHTRSQKGGVSFSGLAKTILQDKDPRKQTKWRSAFSGGLTTRTRILLRNGNIGAEAIVEKDGKRIFRLLNNSFEIPGRTIPEGMVTAMNGRPLSDLVEHPFVTDQMIITRISTSSRRIEGRYKDKARITT